MKSNLAKYEAFFGRPADETLPPAAGETASCFVHRFSPRHVGFLKRLFTPLHDVGVYLTDGMSATDMAVPPDLRKTYPTRIELMACTEAPIVGSVDNQDIVTRLLQWLVGAVAERQAFVGPLTTIDLGEKMCPNSEMTAFFFGVPDGVDMQRLCRCTPAAQLVVSVMPITPTELRITEASGPEALIEVFEREEVKNLFDPFRKGVAEPGVAGDV